MTDILVVDDDESIATAFHHFLSYEGHHFRIAGGAEDAVRLIAERTPDIVIMDIRMPGRGGLQALQEMRSRFPGVYVVMMTAYGTSQTSIDAIRAGAFDYLTKPLDLDELRTVIAKAVAAQRVRDKAVAAAPNGAALTGGVGLVGKTPAMLEVYKTIGRLATTDVPALVVGEHGTGKHLVTRTIHDNSARSDDPFTAIDCIAAPEAAIEAALFGQPRGSIHLANVDALPPRLQARLARDPDDRQAPATPGRPGGVRLLASTERDLFEDVRSGAFSRKFLDTLGVVTIRLPPLRERREDIPHLVWHFIQRFNDELNRTLQGVDDGVSKQLQNYFWPGNIGELERVVKRACIVARSDVITADDIAEKLLDGSFDRQEVESTLARNIRTALHERLIEKSAGQSPPPFHDIVDMVESILVNEALVITNGNQVKAAEILGVNRATLRKKAGTTFRAA